MCRHRHQKLDIFIVASYDFRQPLTRTVEPKPAQSTMQSGPEGGKHLLRVFAASLGAIAAGVRRVKVAPSASARGKLSFRMSVMAILLAPNALQDSRLRRPEQARRLQWLPLQTAGI